MKRLRVPASRSFLREEDLADVISVVDVLMLER
jgi:hypothetical protein